MSAGLARPVRAARQGTVGPTSTTTTLTGTITAEAVMTDIEFTRLREFVHRRTGIDFAPTKRYFVDKRVQACIDRFGVKDFETWFSAIRLGSQPDLVQDLINSLTVNETYFLREDYQFDGLIHSVLPEIMVDRRKRRSEHEPIKILSLPSSTGEEPYSIAIRLLEEWPPLQDVDVELVACDIDTSVLARARTGIYGARSVERVPAKWLKRWFTAVGQDSYQVDASLREAVTFNSLNICDVDLMRGYRDYDVIFCRNLLIYFDAHSARLAAENLFGALRPGGYLFLGHSESMSRISSIFKPLRFPEGIVYQRPTAGDR